MKLRPKPILPKPARHKAPLPGGSGAVDYPRLMDKVHVVMETQPPRLPEPVLGGNVGLFTRYFNTAGVVTGRLHTSHMSAPPELQQLPRRQTPPQSLATCGHPDEDGNHLCEGQVLT